jgi:hypothetical protein
VAGFVVVDHGNIEDLPSDVWRQYAVSDVLQFPEPVTEYFHRSTMMPHWIHAQVTCLAALRIFNGVPCLKKMVSYHHSTTDLDQGLTICLFAYRQQHLRE